MRFKKPELKFVLDEGVPNAVGHVLRSSDHRVIYLNTGDHLPRGAKDSVVAVFAILNTAILVAMDGDMKVIAKRHGVVGSTYAKLNLLKLSCSEPVAAHRVTAALTLIQHEWHVSAGSAGRRIFIEIMTTVIRTNR